MSTMRSEGFGLVAAMLLTLSACSGGGSGGASGSGAPTQPVATPGPDAPIVVSGSVGDGPVVGAALQMVDADGKVLTRDESTSTADYRLEVPADARLPVLVNATGGTDLVTGRPLDFPLTGAILSSSFTTVNISPLTTLAVRAAQCSAGGLTEAGLQRAWDRIYDEASLGLDDMLVNDPMTDKVTSVNVGTLVLANEALGEAVRRTMAALSASGQPLDGAEILRQVACDLMADRRSGAVDPRVVATFKAAELGVRLETMAGRLEVDGYSATARMDDAIRTIRAQAQVASVGTLPIPESARDQARRLLGAWLDRLPDTRFLAIASTLATQPLASLRSALHTALDASVQVELEALPGAVALGDATEIQSIEARLEASSAAAAPLLSVSVDRSGIVAGETVTVSWAAEGADLCQAVGAWSGQLATQGARKTAALYQSSSFGVVCAGVGGTVQRSVAVTVDGAPASGTTEPAPAPTEPAPAPTEPAPTQPAPTQPAPTQPAPTEPAPTEPGTSTGGSGTGSTTPPPPQPTVQLRAGATTVVSGGSTTLSWSSAYADSCNASGGWSGARAVSGSQTVGPLQRSTTFSLSCTGAGGSAMTMISITVNGTLALRWEAPTQAVDGSPLSGLSGYRIHYGQISRNYTDVLSIPANVGGTYSVSVPPGTYYVAMTAIGLDGSESDYSNEVVRVVQ
jgi:hypothetical protein